MLKIPQAGQSDSIWLGIIYRTAYYTTVKMHDDVGYVDNRVMNLDTLTDRFCWQLTGFILSNDMQKCPEYKNVYVW